ncbi:MAG TPA: hypothetical protein VF017_08765 [Thermoanaerobaculia bacterium]|nr:hypothetical protein [Thermoanaerobaculia bacterium]
MNQPDDAREHQQTPLSRLLRQADPARDGGDLAPEQVARMRRTVLQASREAAEPTPTRLAWRFALAAAALGGLALVLLWASRAPQPVEPPAVASLELALPAPAALPAEAAPPTEAPPLAPARSPRRRPAFAHAAGRDVAATEPAAVALAGRRQLHLQSPSGTRVVWVLDPDFSLETQGDTR